MPFAGLWTRNRGWAFTPGWAYTPNFTVVVTTSMTMSLTHGDVVDLALDLQYTVGAFVHVDSLLGGGVVNDKRQ